MSSQWGMEIVKEIQLHRSGIEDQYLFKANKFKGELKKWVDDSKGEKGTLHMKSMEM